MKKEKKTKKQDDSFIFRCLQCDSVGNWGEKGICALCLKKNKTNNRINEVCGGCGITANYLSCLKKYGRPPLKKAFSVSTFHTGICDVCKEKTHVTEARDFFYPDFTLILELIRK